jgi:hypothetical protein
MLNMETRRVTINITVGEYKFFKDHPEISLSAWARKNLDSMIEKYTEFEKEYEKVKA